MIDDNPIVRFADRINAIKTRAREDMAVVIDEAKAAGHDPATLRKIASLLEMDEDKREERDTLLDLYRSAAGIDPPMENVDYRQNQEDWRAADLFEADLSVRDVAKRMKISTGKAHKLRVRWCAFKLFTRSRGDEHREHPAHDADGVIESAAPGANPSASPPPTSDLACIAAGAAEPVSPPDCWCDCCRIERGAPRDRMILCPDCGNKRCPKATDHRLACTNSNAPGQPGSRYHNAPISPPDEPAREDGSPTAFGPEVVIASGAETHPRKILPDPSDPRHDLPTVTLDDGTKVVPATHLPPPSVMAMRSLQGRREYEDVLSSIPRARNRPARDKDFDFQQAAPSDDAQIPQFLRRGARA